MFKATVSLHVFEPAAASFFDAAGTLVGEPEVIDVSEDGPGAYLLDHEFPHAGTYYIVLDFESQVDVMRIEVVPGNVTNGPFISAEHAWFVSAERVRQHRETLEAFGMQGNALEHVMEQCKAISESERGITAAGKPSQPASPTVQVLAHTGYDN